MVGCEAGTERESPEPGVPGVDDVPEVHRGGAEPPPETQAILEKLVKFVKVGTRMTAANRVRAPLPAVAPAPQQGTAAPVSCVLTGSF